MEGFKKLPKGTPCYKEGGSVYKSRHSEKSEMSEDIAQDKKIVKKAFSIHDKQEHPGEKTDLSKLKKGGRAKKAVGTVKKYACGGGVYGAKKTKENIKSIDSAKDCKPKKLAMGGSLTDAMGISTPAKSPSAPVGQGQGAVSDLEKRRAMEKMARAKKYLSPDQQSELIKQDPRAAGLTGNIGYKKGGKACYSEGGSLKETNAEENPGLAKLPTNVRNKMGYMRKGGKAKKMNTGGTCS
jgi:hypothetical protein